MSDQLIVKQVPIDTYTPWLKDGYSKWILLRDFTYMGIVVPEGYIFNGSSVPRVFWWLYPPSYAPAWKASCIHDYCYSHYYPYISKRDADKLLKNIMNENGASKFSQWLFYTGVRLNINGGGWGNKYH